jgi:hypothetical protein
MNTAEPDHQIERFKTLRRVENQRPEAADVVCEVNEEMKFRFVKPLGIPKSGCSHKIEDGRF